MSLGLRLPPKNPPSQNPNGLVESDYFDISGIYSHNCRAFLSPWYEKGGIEQENEDDQPVFVGRFNIGAVSLLHIDYYLLF